MALSYLHHNAMAPEEWRVRAHDDQYIDMNMLPASDIDPRAVLRGLPPLIKGYLRIGAYIGDGAVIGSGVELVAPLEVGENATIGAGSTLTRSAPDGQLTLERARQVSVEGWKRPVKKK